MFSSNISHQSGRWPWLEVGKAEEETPERKSGQWQVSRGSFRRKGGENPEKMGSIGPNRHVQDRSSGRKLPGTSASCWASIEEKLSCRIQERVPDE